MTNIARWEIPAVKRIFLIVLVSTLCAAETPRRAIAAAVFGLAALAFAPALAEGLAQKTDLYDRPVLAIDPGMHTARIWAQAVDAAGRYAVTGSEDRTVRIWSIADGKLLRTIWIPVGPEYVGTIYAVAISPDGSTIAAGGWTENRNGRARSIFSIARPGHSSTGFPVSPMSRIFSHSQLTAVTSRPR
jgi:WD40 repeat protein